LPIQSLPSYLEGHIASDAGEGDIPTTMEYAILGWKENPFTTIYSGNNFNKGVFLTCYTP
jgi:hypothetical protein